MGLANHGRHERFDLFIPVCTAVVGSMANVGHAVGSTATRTTKGGVMSDMDGFFI